MISRLPLEAETGVFDEWKDLPVRKTKKEERLFLAKQIGINT